MYMFFMNVVRIPDHDWQQEWRRGWSCHSRNFSFFVNQHGNSLSWSRARPSSNSILVHLKSTWEVTQKSRKKSTTKILKTKNGFLFVKLKLRTTEEVRSYKIERIVVTTAEIGQCCIGLGEKYLWKSVNGIERRWKLIRASLLQIRIASHFTCESLFENCHWNPTNFFSST